MTRAVIYARSALANDVVHRTDYLRGYAERNGYTVVGECSDYGGSGSTDNPGLAKALEEIETQNAEIFLIESEDRVVRGPGRLILDKFLKVFGAKTVTVF